MVVLVIGDGMELRLPRDVLHAGVFLDSRYSHQLRS